MCGRFYIDTGEDQEEMQEILQEINQRYQDKPAILSLKTGEIRPTNVVPVLSNSKKLEPGYFLMKWGFAKYDGKGVVINARSEGIFEKTMFRKAVQERRCLIPATNYYEWQETPNGKIKYAIKHRGTAITYMAGVYRMVEGAELPEFTIATCAPAHDIEFIHDRMPLILAGRDIDEWISPDADIPALIGRANQDVQYAIA